MNELKCLSEQELSEFVHGRIDELRVVQIAEHLEACGNCQDTVVMLGEKSDTFIGQLRSPAVPDALESEEACNAAIERLADGAANEWAGPTATYPKISETDRLGPYQIEGKLGVGGMGTVFQATHTKLKRSVAIKLLPASCWANPAAVARFEREMEVIGGLDHPNIVRANDAGEENGMHYLVMEHVDGMDLSQVVKRLGRLQIADACEIARQAAIGLQYANENHLVHRDIKPSNLMLARAKGQESRVEGQNTHDSARLSTLDSRPSTSVKILDLGLALLGESHTAHENELTTVGQLMGTLDYMSPEQGMDSHDVDIRADIYSLGATLYKLLTGRAPFASPQFDTLLKKVTALANKPVPPIKQLRSDIPDKLATVIDRMLSKDPAERYASPQEVAAALEPFTRDANLSDLLQTAEAATEPPTTSIPPVIASVQGHPNGAAGVLISGQPLGFPGTGGFAVAGKARNRTPAQITREFNYWMLFMLLIFGAIGVAGVIFHIKTDNGELVIEADDNTQVLVRQDGKTVRQLEVAKGPNSVTIRSGTYRIELQGKSDELVMTQDDVTIRRGQRVVVRVQQRVKETTGTDQTKDMEYPTETEEMYSGGYGGEMSESAMAGGAEGPTQEDLYSGVGGLAAMYGEGSGEDPSSEMGAMSTSGFRGPKPASQADDPVPTYDGKTYREWLAELNVERKPERLTDAIRAFASLGDGDEKIATESVSAIMQIMRRNGSYVIDDSPQGKLIQQAIKVLQQMPGEIVIKAVEDELENGNTRSRSFVNFFLHSSFYEHAAIGSPHIDLSTAALRHNKTLYQKLLGIPDDEAALIRVDGVKLVVQHAESRGVALTEVEGLLPKLRGMLKEKDFVILASSTLGIFDVEKDNQDLVPALIRLLKSQDPQHQLQAARLLGQLGSRSASATETLLKIVRPLAESAPLVGTTSPENYGSGFAPGMMPGMMGGGGVGGFAGGGYMAYNPNQDLNYVTITAFGNIGPSAKAALPILRKIAAKKPTATAPLADAGGGEGFEEAMGGYGGEGGGGGFGVSYEAEYAKAAEAAIARIEGKDTSPIRPEPVVAPGGGGFF